MSAALSIRSFPRAIIHVDGDSFFASCEQMKNPNLRGKPVITGMERGIASSMSIEAKRMGVTRAMPIHMIKKICPDVVFLPSDYETYSLMSLRLYAIVRRYTDAVEEYGVDECFGDLTGYRRVNKMTYIEMAERIKHELDTELGVTFSVGLGPTKVLAKVASKWQKPSGFTVIPGFKAHEFLVNLDVGELWGIGPQTANFLRSRGIKTALEFARAEQTWVYDNLSKPFQAVWHELRSEVAIPMELETKTAYQSISKTKTFTPPSKDKTFIFAQLSKNIENACIKARRYHQAPTGIFAFLKTQEFRYQGMELALGTATAIPSAIIEALREPFEKTYTKNVLYRATGVTLVGLEPERMQPDLFDGFNQSERMYAVYEQADKMSAKYGKHTLFLGTSFLAHQKGNHQNQRKNLPARQIDMLKGETKRKRVGIPLIGEVL